MPFFPRRFFRFMAKAELFWFPLEPRHHGRRRLPRAPRRAGRGGDRDGGRARREGHAVVMFPEGTRRRKGHAQEARGALAHGRRAHRARGGRSARAGRDRGHRAARAARPAPRRVRAARSRSTTSPSLPTGEAARVATDRLARGGRRAGAHASREAAARHGRRLVRAPRLPRACRSRCAGRTAGPANALIGFTNMLLRLWQDERPRTVLVAWDTLDVPTYRHDGARGVPERARVRRRAPRAARPPPGARRVGGVRVREGSRATRRTTSSPPRRTRGGGAGGDGARRDVGSRRVPARRRRT